MRTSAPGSSRHAGAGAPGRVVARGFTLIELLVVLMIVALSAAVVTLSLRDRDASQLEEEAARLATLLETARAEARVSGSTVRWLPVGAEEAAAAGVNAPQFRFTGMGPSRTLPTRWLDPEVSAQVVGGSFVLLGPDAILPPQRLVLRLHDRRLELVSDGLGPFAVAVSP